MLHIQRYTAFPTGYQKKLSGIGPLSGTLVEEYDARYALDPTDLVGGAVWGVPTFLWIVGDGTTPTIGPVGTNLAVTGSVSTNVGPYQYPDATTSNGEYYNGTSCRNDATKAINVAADEDLVVMGKFRMYDNATSTGGKLFATNSGFGFDDGFSIQFTNDFFTFQIGNLGGFPATTVCANPGWRSWNCGGGVLNHDGNMYAWLDGVVGTNRASLAGAYGSTGIGVGGGGNGGAGTRAAAGTEIEWVAAWVGAGLYETWSADSWRLVKRLHMESLGLRETRTNSKYWLFTKPTLSIPGDDGGASYRDHNGTWRFCSGRTPRAGNATTGGIFSVGQGNFVAGTGNRNYDPSDATNWTMTGGSAAIVNDAAALATANASIWGPSVWELTNASGSTQVAYRGTAAVVGVPANFFCLARYTAGANALLGYRNSGTGVFTSVGTILDSYALTRFLQQTPPGANNQYAVQLPNNTTLRIVAVQLDSDAGGVGMNASPAPTGELPYTSAFAYQEEATTEHTPVVGSGSYLTHIAPSSWSNTGCLADDNILPCVTTPGDILHAETVAAGWATSDGTTQIQTTAPSVPTDGVYVYVWSAWMAALQYIQQGIVGTAVTGAYDGNKGTAGAMKVSPTIRTGEIAVKLLQIRTIP